MLSIPNDFFNEEIRDGFCISEIMKKSWAVQLTLLEEILEIADKHNIKIWVDYGTLLGAIRHHGYIPWDDDLDTAVLRDDYEPLIMYLYEELPKYRVVTSFYTTKLCNKPTTVVSSRKNFDIGNSSIEKEITRQNYGFPCGSWVDIFPMDYIPDNLEQWNIIKNLYTAAFGIAINIDNLIAKGTFENDLYQLEELTGVHLKKDENIRHSIWMLAENIAKITSKKDSHYVGWYGGALHDDDSGMRPIQSFSHIIYKDFEMIKVPVPSDYDTILKITYGNDYMTPQKTLSGHDYPHFKNQELAIIASSKLGQLGDIF